MSELKKAPNIADVYIASRIRTRRMLIGLSQEKLGQALGVTFQQIQKYERGANRVSAGRLQSIGAVLGVPAAYFYEGLPHEDSRANGAEDLTLNVLNTNEGVRLARAFAAIDDDKLRHRLVEMAEAIACLRKLA